MITSSILDYSPCLLASLFCERTYYILAKDYISWSRSDLAATLGIAGVPMQM